MTEYQKDTFIKGFGIDYFGRIEKIKKSSDKLQPIYEAFTNALEAITLLKRAEQTDNNGKITLKLYFTKSLFDNTLNFHNLTIEDTGIGFDDKNFRRIIFLDDNSKGFQNKGSGRVQLLHFFNNIEYTSIYKDDSSKNGFKKRTFKLSKRFLQQNSLIKYIDKVDVEAENNLTTLVLSEPFPKNQLFYNGLNIKEIKVSLILHYLMNFCSYKDELPEIKLQENIDNEKTNEVLITKEDIPEFDDEKNISVSYSKISNDTNCIEYIDDKKEEFLIKAFKIDKEFLKENSIKLTSKGEILDNKVKLEYLKKDENIENNRYLFLISGNYIDSKVEDTRGKVNILNKDELKELYRSNSIGFDKAEILIEDIQTKANQTVLLIYDEIKELNKQKAKKIETLKKMFLLNDETIKNISGKLNINDTEDKILEKVYAADAKIIAKKDAEMKVQLERIEHLNPTDDDYFEKLENEANQLVKAIPLQNKVALTQYIARRILVLKLFETIKNRKLEIQETNSRNIDEKLLHNLIFKQHSENSEASDLWLINEDFIYFKGVSESRLCDAEVDGLKIFKDEFSEQEEALLHSLGEKRETKKPDILLFPDEGKCIIIEFKNPKENVSTHLGQINNYAGLIRNFSKDEFQIDTFYGYLIGEAIDPTEVRRYSGYFKYSYQFDYLFNPYEPIVGENGRNDGSLYTEVIKYSTLLKRAQQRNQIFKEKLNYNVDKQT